jgi:hypothetical protein
MSAQSEANELNVDEPLRPMFGSDLRIDSDDEEYLEELPEIERELILEERFRIWQKFLDEKALYDKYVKKDVPEPIQAPRARAAKPPSSKSAAPPRKARKVEYRDDESSSSGSESDSSYSSSDDERSVLRKRSVVAATEEEIAKSMDMSLTIDIAKRLQVSRDSLSSSYQNVPQYLRDSTLVDLLVRVPSSVPGEYIIGQISSVVEVAGRFDLITSIPSGDHVTSTVPVTSVSNSEITESELTVWTDRVGVSVARDLARISGKKIAQMKQVNEFVWDDSMINRMLEEKKQKSVSRVNSVKLTLEIAKLRTALQAELGALANPSLALSDEQRMAITANIARINSEISHLESEYRQAQRAFQEANAHQYGIVAINHRNRKEQRKQELDDARNRHLAAATTTAAQHEANSVPNPFKRRECKPVVMWDVGNKSPKKANVSDGGSAGQNAVNTLLAVKKLTDCLDMTKLAEIAIKAVNMPGGRLNAQRRAMQTRYSKTVSPAWAVNATGEVMDFDEWKRRVAMDDGDEE